MTRANFGFGVAALALALFVPSVASAQAPAAKSFVTRLFDSVGPGDAQSVPLPLLVLAGLAVLLLLAAAGTWLVKRLQARQARQMTPAPAPARRR